ncbi:hypothetical protein GCM10009828_069290 [Actinoplanes couchii]|uniref:Uncharacterized protein n=1 Tax=Actinoplanes couchii TaxID=403638 RepID=A0ABQ3X5K8_9ACTN|nr:hypothetical protein Aco03nite_021990 [Actinoplanes couchii]
MPLHVPSKIEFSPLHEDRPPREFRIPSAVVEVQMAVDHISDVVDGRPDSRKGSPEPNAPGLIVLIDVRMPTHPGIHENPPVRMLNEIPKGGLNPGKPSPSLPSRPNKPPKIHPPNRDIPHPPKYPDHTPQSRPQSPQSRSTPTTPAKQDTAQQGRT